MTPEQQMQVYSRQLAEYTLQQWNEYCKQKDVNEQREHSKSTDSGRAIRQRSGHARHGSDATQSSSESSPNRATGTLLDGKLQD